MIQIDLLSESSLIAYLGEGIDPALSCRVRQVANAVQREYGALLVDMVPSYNSLHITFCPGRIDGTQLTEKLQPLLQRLEEEPLDNAVEATVEIPVYYGSEVALDMAEVTGRSGLTGPEVIALHSGACYRVYAIGFSPGFCYLGSVPERLATPRKGTPRRKVPAGSVAIADRQTAIYPDDSPGGWQVLGRTPLPMHPADERAPRLQVGGLVRFKAIDREEFLLLGGRLI